MHQFDVIAEKDSDVPVHSGEAIAWAICQNSSWLRFKPGTISKAPLNRKAGLDPCLPYLG